MQIGKKKYTNSNKKAYRKPVLEVVDIDREIVLMNTSGNDGGPPPDPVSSFSNPESTQPPSKSSDPFGGGTPDYER